MREDERTEIVSPAPDQINDAKHWRDRAEEALVKARSMHDAVARRTMAGVAKQYLRLARQAEKRTCKN